MEFRSIVNEIQRGTEEELFKAADPGEILQRKADAERMRKEHIKELMKSLGPNLVEIYKLIPVVKDLIKEYTDDQADWIGNYSSQSEYSYEPTKISFNIKIYGWHIPDWAKKKMDRLDLENAAEEYGQQFMADSLEGFAEDMVSEYEFIEDYFQGGRMGGWFVFKVSGIDISDTDAIIDAFDENEPDEGWLEPNTIKDSVITLRTAKTELEKRIRDYTDIAGRVESGRKSVEKQLGSRDFWRRFFKDYA
jgi:hypothetical protein